MTVKTEKSQLEQTFLFQVKAAGLPEPTLQYRPHFGKRNFAFDFAWIEQKVLVEIQGGIWIGGAHARGWGIERDMQKTAEALIEGWVVLYVGAKHVRDGTALQWTERILQGRGWLR